MPVPLLAGRYVMNISEHYGCFRCPTTDCGSSLISANDIHKKYNLCNFQRYTYLVALVHTVPDFASVDVMVGFIFSNCTSNLICFTGFTIYSTLKEIWWFKLVAAADGYSWVRCISHQWQVWSSEGYDPVWAILFTSEEHDPVQFSHWSREKGFKGTYFFK